MLLRALPRALAYRRRCQTRYETRYETPFTISFLVTSRCNLRCQHCFYHETLGSRRDELTLDQYERLSRSIDDLMLGVFAGGEPFMRRDLADIVRLFQVNSGMLVTGIASNGQLTQSVMRQTEAMCEADRNKIVNLSLSIEGFADTHDEIRGAGTFDQVLRTWRELKRLSKHHPNLMLTITTVVSTLNQDSARDFVTWATHALEPVAVNVLLVRQSPRAGDDIKEVRPEAYRAVQDAALDSISSGRLARKLNPLAIFNSTMADIVHKTMLSGRREFHCHAGEHGAIVDYKGDVSACEVLMEDPDHASIGNLKDHDMDFLSLWNSAGAQRARQVVNCHKSCQSCTHETMGLVPSLLFSPNKLGFVFGQPKEARRRTKIHSISPRLGRDLEARR